MNKNNVKSGQTMVEFALLLPLLFLLVMGLFDMGRAILYYAILNSAIREGTRYAIVQPRCDYRSDPVACNGIILDSYPLNCTNAQSFANQNICNEVTNKLFSITELSNITITIDHIPSSNDAPVISIDIDYLFEPVTPGLALIGDLALHVNSEMIMTPIAEP